MIQNERLSQFKIIVIGEPQSGKSRLICRFITNRYEMEDEKQYYTKRLKYEEEITILQIWEKDFNQEQNFQNVCFLICFDPQCLSSLQSTIEFVKTQLTVPLFICITKSDEPQLQQNVKLLHDFVNQTAKKSKIKLFSCSAKLGTGVHQMFQTIATDLRLWLDESLPVIKVKTCK